MEKDSQKKLSFLIITFLLICYAAPVYARSIIIAFRNDDISAKSDPGFELEVLRIFNKYGIKPLYAVIPAKHGKILRNDMPIFHFLQQWHENGWVEIAMHGYTHEKKFKGVAFHEQKERIRLGKTILQDLFDVSLLFFAPPWNAVDKNTFKALTENGIILFSGYLGEKPFKNIIHINSNCNLFEGPLGSFEEKLEMAKASENNVLLVPLFHSGYDFNENSLESLDNLLRYTDAQKDVQFISFHQLINEDKYAELLRLSNDAGYRLKFLQKNKYIRKIMLNIPILSGLFRDRIMMAENHYYKGNYAATIGIYNWFFTGLWVAFSLCLLIFASIVFWVWRSQTNKESTSRGGGFEITPKKG